MSDTAAERRTTGGAPDVTALSPQQLLAAAARGREEKVVPVPGLGPVLIGEITGIERADVLSHQVELARKEQIDVKGYQRRLLQASVLDPTSPPGERTAAFKTGGEAAAFMQIGAAKIRRLIDEIEEFSGMQAATTPDGKKELVEAGKDVSSSTRND